MYKIIEKIKSNQFLKRQYKIQKDDIARYLIFTADEFRKTNRCKRLINEKKNS